MRWLVAHPGPDFSVADVFTGWVEGLRELGEQVHVFNLADRLSFYDQALLPTSVDGQFRKALSGKEAIELSMNGLAAALFKVRPDVLLVVSGIFTPYEMLDQARSYGTEVIALCTESPYEDDRQLALAAHCDLVLLNDPVNLERFQQVAPTVYVPHAYRPDVHHPGESRYAPCDFAFVGTGYPSRVWFFEQMDLTGLDVVLGGNWQRIGESSPLYRLVGHDQGLCLGNEDAADLYRAARVGINTYRRETGAGLNEAVADPSGLEMFAGVAIGPREVEMAACGLPFLRDPRPESDAVFPMLPVFDGPQEAGELLRWWLTHPVERQAAADHARASITGRTFAAHAAQLLQLLDRQPVTITKGAHS